MFKIRFFAALLASLTTLHMTQGSDSTKDKNKPSEAMRRTFEIIRQNKDPKNFDSWKKFQKKKVFQTIQLKTDNNDSSSDNSKGGDNVISLDALKKENDNDNDNKAILDEVNKLEEANNLENKKKTPEPSNNNISGSFIDINGDSNNNNNINGATSDSSTTEQDIIGKMMKLQKENKIQNSKFIKEINKQKSDNEEAMNTNNALTNELIDMIDQQNLNINNQLNNFEQQNNNNINAFNEKNKQLMNNMNTLSNDLNRQTRNQANNDTKELKIFANEKRNKERNMAGSPSKPNNFNSYKKDLKKNNNNNNSNNNSQALQPNTNANSSPIIVASSPKYVDLEQYVIKPDPNKANSPSNNFLWQNAKTPETPKNNNISLENQFTYPSAETTNSDNSDNNKENFDFDAIGTTFSNDFSNNNNNTSNNLRKGEPSVISLENDNSLIPKSPIRKELNMNKNNTSGDFSNNNNINRTFSTKRLSSYTPIDLSDDNMNKKYKSLQRNILVDNNNDNNNNNINGTPSTKRLPSYTPIVPSDNNSTNKNKKNTRRNSSVKKNTISQPSILTPPKPDTSSDNTKSVPGRPPKKTQQKDLKTENNNETPSNIDPKTVVGLLIVGALCAGAIYAAVGNKKSDK